jgi:hypothetical protein
MASTIAPTPAFSRPGEVLAHGGLAAEEKRAILAAWASDACAVESAPALRRWPGGVEIPVDEVLAALAALDQAPQENDPAPREARAGLARLRRLRLARLGDLKPLAWAVTALGPLAKPRVMRH